MKKISLAVLCFATLPLHAQFMGMGGFGGFGGSQSFGGFGGGTTTFKASQAGKHIEFESSNLPIIIIETGAGKIDNGKKTKATMRVINNEKGRNSVNDKKFDYNGGIGIKLRGESSLMFEQKSFTVELWDDNGKSVDAPLLGMPANDDWALIAAYNDISMMRNPIAYDLWTAMGHWGPRNRMAEVMVDGEYQGVYMLVETIKGSKERLSLANLKPEDESGVELTGGYLLRIDAADSDDLTFTSKVSGISKTGGMFGGMQNLMGSMGMGDMFQGGFGGFGAFGPSGDSSNGRQVSNPVTWTIRTPKKADITDKQRQYIENYIHETESAIARPDFADPEKGYAKYISVSSFVDYLIHTEVSLNADGMKRSTYFFKTKQKQDGTGGKLHAGSVWDYNLAFGNASFNGCDNVTTWVHQGGETLPTTFMFKRLMEDPAFVEKVKSRYTELRKGVLCLDSIYAYIDKAAAQLQEAQQRQYSKYTDLLVADGRETVDLGTGLVKRAGQESARDSSMTGMGGVIRDFGTMYGWDWMRGAPGPDGDNGNGNGDSNGNGSRRHGGHGGGMPMGSVFGGGMPMGGGFGPADMGDGMSMGGFGGGMGGFGGMGGGMMDMFSGYRVSSYDHEIQALKSWFKSRLEFLDSQWLQ